MFNENACNSTHLPATIAKTASPLNQFQSVAVKPFLRASSMSQYDTSGSEVLFSMASCLQLSTDRFCREIVLSEHPKIVPLLDSPFVVGTMQS